MDVNTPIRSIPVKVALYSGDILSATIVAPDAMTADAYATAFMVLGSEEAKSLCAKVPGLDYFIICSDSIGDGYHPEYSEGFRRYMVTADK